MSKKKKVTVDIQSLVDEQDAKLSKAAKALEAKKKEKQLKANEQYYREKAVVEELKNKFKHRCQAIDFIKETVGVNIKAKGYEAYFSLIGKQAKDKASLNVENWLKLMRA